jgi:hypothetical protein
MDDTSRYHQYTKGYESGNQAWHSGESLGTDEMELHDEDYKRGYRDGAANRLYNPPLEAPHWNERRSPGWWHGGE